MINFPKYNILFFVLAVPLVISSFFISYWWLWILLFFILYTIGLTLGSINVRSNFYMKVICEGDEKSNAIALTFDDGPNANNTPKVLEILKKHNIKACFFCIGKNIDANNELLAKIHSDGHIIGNHTHSHSYVFDLFSTKKMKADLQAASNSIYNVIEKRTKLFRPPYGVTNPNLARAVRNFGLISVGWSLRSLDTTANGNTDKILKRLENVKAGDIVLFHDNISEIPEILEKFIELVKSKNINFIGLDDLLKCNAYD
ncbi:MAG: polysaccharide deacetylase family protein [Bacteroidia bacterium]|nr:polysaccharide deacetylase family protein [Bacteroidia bacterium]